MTKSGKKKVGIFLRTFSLFLILAAVVMVLFAIVTIPWHRHTIIKSMESHAKSISASTAQISGSSIVSEDYSFIVDHCLEVLKGSVDIFYIVIVRHDGFSLIHTANNWEQIEKPYPEWEKIQGQTTKNDIIYSKLIQKKVFHHSFPLNYSGIDWGWIHLGMSLDSYNKDLKNMYKRLLVLGLSCLTIATVGAYFFARRLTIPLISLRQVTDQVTAGNLDVRSEISTGDEVEDLAKSFNEMTRSLQKSTIELTMSNKKLNQEINERKQAEKALQKSEKKYRTLFEGSADGVLIIDGDNFVDCNSASVKILGYNNKKEVLNTHPSQLSPPLQPDGQDSFEKANQMLAIAFDQGSNRFEWYHQRKNGEVFPVEVLLTSIPFKGRNCLHVSWRDIEERKRAEEALRESEEKYYSLIANIPSVTWITNSKGETTFISPNVEKIYGYTPEEIHEAGEILWFRRIHPDDVEMVKEAYGCLFKKTNQFDVEYRIKRKDGEWIWLHDKAVTTYEKGGMQFAYGVFSDITEQKEMEKELIKAQKLESVAVLAGGIAHDFNNSLQAILGYISLAKLDVNPNEEIHEYLEEANKAVLHSRGLTHQLLTFSKGGEPVKKAISISELIADSISLALSGSNVKCELGISDDLWEIDGDKGQLNQVFSNLIINADQAMPDGGNIKVWTENINVVEKDQLQLQQGRYVKITIEDHGKGIPQKHLQNIFDPYFTTKQKGSGLGLATAYSIVKKHDGHIAVESEAGVGTTFHVYLPASRKEVLEKPDQRKIKWVSPELTEGKNTSSARKGKVLLMDDEYVIRFAISKHLGHLRYEVEAVEEGSEAIRLYESASGKGKPFDAVIMDLTISGGMGGKETIKRLLEIDPEVRAIVVSGYANDPIMANYKEYGFKGVLAKPHEIHELDEALQKVITTIN